MLTNGCVHCEHADSLPCVHIALLWTPSTTACVYGCTHALTSETGKEREDSASKLAIRHQETSNKCIGKGRVRPLKVFTAAAISAQSLYIKLCEKLVAPMKCGKIQELHHVHTMLVSARCKLAYLVLVCNNGLLCETSVESRLAVNLP